MLQNDLDKLAVWKTRCDMEFHPSKFEVVRVTTSRNSINTVYSLHGQILEVVMRVEYLGSISQVAYPGTPAQKV